VLVIVDNSQQHYFPLMEWWPGHTSKCYY